MSIKYEFWHKNARYDHGYNLQFPAHLHKNIELVRMRDGASNCFADTKKYLIEKGDYFIAFPNQIHYYETFGHEDYDIFYINPELIPQYTDLLQSNCPRSAKIPAEKITPRMNSLLDGLIEILSSEERGPYYDEMRSGYLLAFFSEILLRLELVGPESGELGMMKSIVDYCAHNYMRELSLSSLSEDLHVSRYYISHIFGSKLNVRFNDYINSLRISKACLMLADSNASVTEVGSRVGFSTIRTFNRAFLRQTGLSPSEYRRRASISPMSEPLTGKKPEGYPDEHDDLTEKLKSMAKTEAEE